MLKIDNEVYAIYDVDTNTYMSSFVVQNREVALRNFEFSKANLIKQCGDADFINKLELRKMEIGNKIENIKKEGVKKENEIKIEEIKNEKKEEYI